MRISDKGIQLIKNFEGFSNKPYRCSAGVWTIGYGHTKGIYQNTQKIKEEQAEELLRQDVQVSEGAIKRLISVELNQNEYDALCSFVFNLGAGSLQRSTLRIKLNRGDDCSDEFLKWNKAGGKVLAGLTKRRIAERNLFLTSI